MSVQLVPELGDPGSLSLTFCVCLTCRGRTTHQSTQHHKTPDPVSAASHSKLKQAPAGCGWVVCLCSPRTQGTLHTHTHTLLGACHIDTVPREGAISLHSSQLDSTHLLPSLLELRPEFGTLSLLRALACGVGQHAAAASSTCTTASSAHTQPVAPIACTLSVYTHNRFVVCCNHAAAAMGSQCRRKQNNEPTCGRHAPTRGPHVALPAGRAAGALRSKLAAAGWCQRP